MQRQIVEYLIKKKCMRSSECLVSPASTVKNHIYIKCIYKTKRKDVYVYSIR
jgi:hypothetical protein